MKTISKTELKLINGGNFYTFCPRLPLAILTRVFSGTKPRPIRKPIASPDPIFQAPIIFP